MNNRRNVENLFPVQVLRFSVKKFWLSSNLVLLTVQYAEADLSPHSVFLCVSVCVRANASYCK